MTGRPLTVFKEDGQWVWGCRMCQWVSPQPLKWWRVAMERAEMHFDVAHSGPFHRFNR
jgi:hypothetical protein